MKTFYAAPERENQNKIKDQTKVVGSIDHLDSFINAFPYPVVVLNEKRQIVFSNKTTIENLKAKEFSDFLGQRPGEILKCVYSDECESGCGTSIHCKVCGAVNTILEAQKMHKTVTKDCRIIAGQNKELEFYNYEVSASPIQIDNEQYVIFSLIDNTAIKKMEMMERLFYHDILNTAGNIKNLSELALITKDENSRERLLKMLGKISIQLADEIEGQRNISKAESGELTINRSNISSSKLIKLIQEQYKDFENRKDAVFIDEKSDDFVFYSDKGLISRILINMIKNALESTKDGEKIKIASFKDNSSLKFIVSNPGVIPEKVKLQIFQKSFSTKSKNRGYGTYSMKLLGEKYLGGKVYFTSNENEGTRFNLELKS